MRAILTVILLLLFIGCTSKPSESFDLVVQNGIIINLETGELSKKDIFISDRRIKKVVPSDSVFKFETKKKIDATNKYVLPGFWDNHVHFRGGDSLIDANKNFLKLFLANGITTVRDAGGDLTVSVMEWKAQMENGSLAGPTIFTSGPKIDGPKATWAGSLEVENDTDIQIALDSLQNIPVDFVKLYDSRISSENYLKTIQEAKRRGLITSGHMPFTVTLEETINAGIDGIEHLYYIMKGCSTNEMEITARLQNKEIGFWGAMPLLLESYSDSVANKTFIKLRENNVYSIPTLHIGEILSYLDEVDHTEDSYLKYMSTGIQKTYEGRIKGALRASEKATKNRKELQRFFGRLAKNMNDAEVKLLAGSDSGAYNSFTYPGISLHRELDQMVFVGISPLEALRASAYNGSQFLQKNTNYGTITKGKIADVVLLNGNPLKKITNTQDIHTVLKEGKVYTKQTLDSLLNSAIIRN